MALFRRQGLLIVALSRDLAILSFWSSNALASTASPIAVLGAALVAAPRPANPQIPASNQRSFRPSHPPVISGPPQHREELHSGRRRPEPWPPSAPRTWPDGLLTIQPPRGVGAALVAALLPALAPSRHCPPRPRRGPVGSGGRPEPSLLLPPSKAHRERATAPDRP